VADPSGERVGHTGVCQGCSRRLDALRDAGRRFRYRTCRPYPVWVESDEQLGLVNREPGECQLNVVGPGVERQLAREVAEEVTARRGIAADVDITDAFEIQEEMGRLLPTHRRERRQRRDLT